MSVPVTETHAHALTAQALELLTQAEALLAYAPREPSLEPSETELHLIRAAKQAHTAVGKIVTGIAGHLDLSTLPPELASKLTRKDAPTLLAELKQEPVLTVFERD